MKFLDQKHPFYRPLWRRMLIIAIIAAWALFEVVYSQEPLWMTIALGFLAFAVWSFVLTWPKDSAQSTPSERP
jgi:hypothetical protein